MELALILLFGLSLLITQVLQLRLIGRVQALRDEVTALQTQITKLRVCPLEAIPLGTPTTHLDGTHIPKSTYGSFTTGDARSTATLSTR